MQATLAVVKPTEERELNATIFLKRFRFYSAVRQIAAGNLGGCQGNLTPQMDERCTFPTSC